MSAQRIRAIYRYVSNLSAEGTSWRQAELADEFGVGDVKVICFARLEQDALQVTLRLVKFKKRRFRRLMVRHLRLDAQ